ncbi:MAG: WbqC family protein [Prevotella sp.]|nr:WbqC family protein [Prevotella sp.]
MTVLLQTTYFGPVQWYQKLNRYDRVLIEQHDSYQKQTYRNRCVIATANGVQALTVPVEHPSVTHRPSPITKDLRISDHNQWRRVHWNALQSAYSESPFFEYYADDIRPFFEKRYEFLIDFNEAIRQTICELIDLHPHVEYTTAFLPPATAPCPPATAPFPPATTPFPPATAPFPLATTPCPPATTPDGSPSGLPADYRSAIHAKHPQPDADFEPKRYWQVFQHKHGFLPNLSILDLLFCMGPESVFYL